MKRVGSQVALVGADTLIGREIRDVLEAGGKASVLTFAANGESNFGEEEGEAVYREALTGNVLEDAFAVVLAGVEEGAEKAMQIAEARKGDLRVIDCTAYLEHRPEARIIGAGTDAVGSEDRILVVAHPAATALALLLGRLSIYSPIAQSVFQIFEPASERGRAGMAELQQQTTGLLSFKTLEKKVFDTQVSFNMVPAYGHEAQFKLETVEQRIETHLATLLSRQAAAPPMPSIRVVQAPVFHGYTFSGWVEFDDTAKVDAVERSLDTEGVDVRRAEHEFPTNAGIAGQSELAIGDIRVDRNNPRAIWIWAVIDNLRVVADVVRDLVKRVQPAA
jgi:aspartate-semialdehyde dehydrogenase